MQIDPDLKEDRLSISNPGIQSKMKRMTGIHANRLRTWELLAFESGEKEGVPRVVECLIVVHNLYVLPWQAVRIRNFVWGTNEDG
jgi:hypothetical protein